jgi:peptide/nickel transport system permease protein
MVQYIIRRSLWMVALLFLVSAVTFVIFYALPSADPAALRAGKSPNPQLVAQIRHQLGLDRPLYEQYFDYVKNIVTKFDLGYSYQNNISVRTQIFQRLPATISLAIGAAILWLTIGILVGIISSVRPRSLIDRLSMGAALVAISAPVYWLALVALYLFADDIGRFPLLPGAGSYVPFSEDPTKWFTSLIMPWCVLAAAFAAFYARLLRSTMIETMGEDYIRTARAKGLGERRVIFRHGLRSAITPIVTAAGLDIGILFGGAILTETVFNIPGIGRLAYDSIVNSDLPMIQGTVLLGAFFIVTANLVVDILYAFVDPRVRY